MRRCAPRETDLRRKGAGESRIAGVDGGILNRQLGKTAGYGDVAVERNGGSRVDENQGGTVRRGALRGGQPDVCRVEGPAADSEDIRVRREEGDVAGRGQDDPR